MPTASAGVGDGTRERESTLKAMQTRKRRAPPQEADEASSAAKRVVNGVVAVRSSTRQARWLVRNHQRDTMMPAAAVVASRRVVTPESGPPPPPLGNETDIDVEGVRRTLFPATRRGVAMSITPIKTASIQCSPQPSPPPRAQRKLLFGRCVAASEIEIPANVRQVYSLVRKMTGSIGGNGSFGPIYGELTMGSMQKMINLCKEHAELDETSRFLDVGSGIGKPNLHVAHDPGVAVSVGIEVEADRWLLGMHCLKAVLDATATLPIEPLKCHNDSSRCMFLHGDITAAQTFDPFTHVYMFSIGFPPLLWCELSKMWNRSSAAYLICYHGPKDIVGHYEFNVELVAQASTSMHGSKEGHAGYIYRRSSKGRRMMGRVGSTERYRCDPYFAPTLEMMRSLSLDSFKEHVDSIVEEEMNSDGALTRSRKRAR
jgi:Histone methylation protein DOT1